MRIKKRSSVINFLISRAGYDRYLEIGVRDPSVNFDRIKCSYKDGVDIAGRCNYIMSSDAFFDTIPPDQIYDIIFIDGLHTCEQVLRDVSNSLEHLSSDGTILLHDCNPLSKKLQVELKNRGKKWNGTVWKAFVILRMTRPDLMMYVVNTDNGIGVIRRGSQLLVKKVDKDKLTYDFLKRDRKKLLNLCPVKKFIRMENKIGRRRSEW